MNTMNMSDADKVLAEHARAASARTAKLHAELCGGAAKAKAIQNAAVMNARSAAVMNAPVVNEDPFVEPVPYWAERAPGSDTIPARTAAPVPAAPSRGVEEPLFADPVSPYAKPGDAPRGRSK